jgi:hypothetical protein
MKAPWEWPTDNEMLNGFIQIYDIAGIIILIYLFVQ